MQGFQRKPCHTHLESALAAEQWSSPTCTKQHTGTTGQRLPGVAIKAADVKTQECKLWSWLRLAAVGSDRTGTAGEGVCLPRLAAECCLQDSPCPCLCRETPASTARLLAAHCPAPAPPPPSPPPLHSRPQPASPSMRRPCGEHLCCVQFPACLWLSPKVFLPAKSYLAASCHDSAGCCWTQVDDGFQMLACSRASCNPDLRHGPQWNSNIYIHLYVYI